LRPAVAKRVRGTTQMFAVVMTINAIKHLDRHAEKAGRLLWVKAGHPEMPVFDFHVT